eukprot:scaffold625_cov420-Prasinococcus_capsulatus_cf.AAC.3
MRGRRPPVYTPATWELQGVAAAGWAPRHHAVVEAARWRPDAQPLLHILPRAACALTAGLAPGVGSAHSLGGSPRSTYVELSARLNVPLCLAWLGRSNHTNVDQCDRESLPRLG